MQYPLARKSNGKMLQRYFEKIPKSECPNIGSDMEDPVVLFERNLYGHLLAGLFWERQFEKVLLEHGWEKFSTANVYLPTEQGDYSYQCMWTMKNI